MTGREVSTPKSLLTLFAVPLGLAVSGMLGAALAWNGVAASADVSVQLPYLISGGMAGLALEGAGLVLVFVQLRRVQQARRRAAFDRVVVAVAELLTTAVRQ